MYLPQLPPMQALGLVSHAVSPYCCLTMLGTDYMAISVMHDLMTKTDYCNAPFVVISKECHPFIEVQVPDDCDDLGTAIRPCVYGSRINGVTLERTQQNFTGKWSLTGVDITNV